MSSSLVAELRPPLRKTATVTIGGAVLPRAALDEAIWDAAGSLLQPHVKRGASRHLGSLAPGLAGQWIDEASGVVSAVISALARHGLVVQQ